MAGKVSLRVKCDGGQGVVRGLVQEDSLEKLISHSMETLGMEESISSSLKLLYGFPPKTLDISDRDKSLSSAGIRSGDTIIFQVSSTASSSSSSSAVPVPASAESQNQGSAEDGQSKQKRLKTDELGIFSIAIFQKTIVCFCPIHRSKHQYNILCICKFRF